ncbi:hypothetical protein NM688_g2951 [Phlebia brevispora]|uniref:Uncharacterized protein n=1 Tax=Phlebia brevispora TaxID=194682 RepID=A0ACC1T7C0_9APHY|nr:hypothetical protein NM688_g2951 [Phlebia brevispora]
MPPYGKRARRRRGDGENAGELKGWASVEDYMNSHDEEMVDDLTDDIDTLLVFAGLFSAIVTAFVVQSYQLLQPNNPQVTVQLLSLIAIRLGGPPNSTFEPFLNATAHTLPTSTSFQPSASTVVINTLWFISLVLSLTSALLGMLVKQWCREYLKWNAVLAPARENVAVRQVRFEAWKRWKVPTLAAFVPALLEIALILFLSGVIFFLWTLQHIVAIILTIIIGISLGVALVVTILPIQDRYCPYRSLTGWALFRVLQLVRGLHGHEDWRQREMRPNPAVLYASSEIPQWIDSQGTALLPALQNKIIVDSMQLNILLRALTWVLKGSDEAHLARDISDCVRSLHDGNATDPESSIRQFSMLIIALYNSAGPTGQDNFNGVKAYLRTLHRKLGGPDEWTRKAGSYVFSLHTNHVTDLAIGPFSISKTRHISIDASKYDPWVWNQAYLTTLDRLVDAWITCNPTDGFWPEELTEAIVSMLCFLRSYATSPGHLEQDELRQSSAATQDFADVLVSIYDRLVPFKSAWQSGLVFMVAEVLCLMGRVYIEKSTLRVRVDSELSFTRQYIRCCAFFATQAYETRAYSLDHRRHLFVMAADAVLRLIHAQYLHRAVEAYVLWDDVGKVFSYMLWAAQASLDGSIKNCGAYVDLPWLFTLVQIFEAERSHRVQHTGAIESPNDLRFFKHRDETENFFTLVAVLGASVRKGLVTGDKPQQEYDRLAALLHECVPSGAFKLATDSVSSHRGAQIADSSVVDLGPYFSTKLNIAPNGMPGFNPDIVNTLPDPTAPRSRNISDPGPSTNGIQFPDSPAYPLAALDDAAGAQSNSMAAYMRVDSHAPTLSRPPSVGSLAYPIPDPSPSRTASPTILSNSLASTSSLHPTGPGDVAAPVSNLGVQEQAPLHPIPAQTTFPMGNLFVARPSGYAALTPTSQPVRSGLQQRDTGHTQSAIPLHDFEMSALSPIAEETPNIQSTNNTLPSPSYEEPRLSSVAIPQGLNNISGFLIGDAQMSLAAMDNAESSVASSMEPSEQHQAADGRIADVGVPQYFNPSDRFPSELPGPPIVTQSTYDAPYDMPMPSPALHGDVPVRLPGPVLTEPQNKPMVDDSHLSSSLVIPSALPNMTGAERNDMTQHSFAAAGLPTPNRPTVVDGGSGAPINVTIRETSVVTDTLNSPMRGRTISSTQSYGTSGEPVPVDAAPAPTIQVDEPTSTLEYRDNISSGN